MRPALVIASVLISCSLVIAAQTPPLQTPGSRVPGASPMPDGVGASPQTTAAAPVTGTAVIRGRVVAADGQQPLRGVEIEVSSTVLLRATGGGRRTTTDERGRFEITGLPGGRYGLSAVKGGYLQVSFDRAIDIAEGETFDDVSFVLSRGSVITGRVVDVHGDPLSGVAVQAMRYRYVNGHRILQTLRSSSGSYIVADFRTDDRGEFRMFGLPPGEYVLRASPRAEHVSAPGGEEGYARTYHSGTMLAARAETIGLGPGETRSGITLRMIPSRMATVAGMALDAEGRPYARASLFLREAETGGGVGPAPMVESAEAGANGAFSLSRIPPGVYYLDLQAYPLPNDTGRLPVVVTGEDLSGLVVHGRQGFPARGRIVGPDGRPPDGLAEGAVSVRFQVFPPHIDSGWTSGTSTAASTFEVLNLRGPQAVRALVPAPSAEWTVRRITHQGRDVTDGTLDFSRGPVEDIVVELTPAVTSLGGTVRDSRGGVPRDALVVVFPDDPARWTAPSRFIHTARPDQDGNFLVRALPPGEYVAIAVPALEPGQETYAGTLETLRHSAESTRVWLAEGESGRVDLRLRDRF